MASLLHESVDISSNVVATTAGTTPLTGTALDMSGYDGVLFIASFASAADGNTILIQQSNDSSGSPDDFSPLAGTSVVTGTSASNETVWVNVYRPTKRYVKAVLARGTSAAAACIALQYGAKSQPRTNVLTGTITGEVHLSPAEGTA